MVAVMFIGMFALMKPADVRFNAVGVSTSSQRHSHRKGARSPGPPCV